MDNRKLKQNILNFMRTPLYYRTFSFAGFDASEEKALILEILSWEGKVTFKLSSDTDFLIIKDGPEHQTAVQQKAIKTKNIQVITEKQFYEMCDRAGRSDEKMSLDSVKSTIDSPYVNKTFSRKVQELSKWKVDPSGYLIKRKNSETENLLTEFPRKFLEQLCDLKDTEMTGTYLDYLSIKEAEWKESGYSDGFYVYSLINAQIERALKYKSINQAIFLLNYRIAHYDRKFLEEAEACDENLESGLKEKADIYWETKPRRTIEFGSCIQSAEDSAVREPIEWDVLMEKEGKALIVSKKILFSMPYNENQDDVSWENCTLRAWLNGEFLQDAFTNEERTAIQPVKNRNIVYIKRKNSEFTLTEKMFFTKDRIFLLSTDEAEMFFPDMKARIKKETPYALKTGLMLLGFGSGMSNGKWWLRSPAGRGRTPLGEGYLADLVQNGGGLHMFREPVELKGIGVCPAMWIKIRKDEK